MVKVAVLSFFPLTPTLQFAKDIEPWGLAYFQIQLSSAVVSWAPVTSHGGCRGWDDGTVGDDGKALSFAVPKVGKVWPCEVLSVLRPWLTSQPHAIELSLNPTELLGLWGMALKTHKDQIVYWHEWFIFIWQHMRSLGNEGVLVISPGLCCKSYCMSSASQNPAPIIPACWKPPERNEGEEGREEGGRIWAPTC